MSSGGLPASCSPGTGDGGSDRFLPYAPTRTAVHSYLGVCVCACVYVCVSVCTDHIMSSLKTGTRFIASGPRV